MTMPNRPLPDDDPNTYPEPGRQPAVPKEPGPAPGPEDPEEEKERETKRDSSSLLGDHTPLDPGGGGSTGAAP